MSNDDFDFDACYEDIQESSETVLKATSDISRILLTKYGITALMLFIAILNGKIQSLIHGIMHDVDEVSKRQFYELLEKVRAIEIEEVRESINKRGGQ